MKRTEHIIIILAFVIRLGYGLYDFKSSEPTGDELDYIYDANAVLEQGPFMMHNTEFKTFVAPGYPWLLACANWVAGSTSMIWINAILSTLIVVLIYKIGRFFLNSFWSKFAAFWAIFYFPYTMYVGELLKETLLQFLVVWSFYLVFQLKLKEKRVIYYYAILSLHI